jgi:hypothetical protein
MEINSPEYGQSSVRRQQADAGTYGCPFGDLRLSPLL